MPTTVFLSLRGDDASRVLESFRRALGEDAQSLVVVPTNDESGYHGSAEVSDLAAAREAFAQARKPFPTLRAYIGGGGRDEPPARPAINGDGQARRGGEHRGRTPERPAERPTEGRPEGRARGAEQRPRAQESRRTGEPSAQGEPPGQGGEPRESRRNNSRRRGGRRGQGGQGGEQREPQA